MSPDVWRSKPDDYSQSESENDELITEKPIIEMASPQLIDKYLAPRQQGGFVSVVWPDQDTYQGGTFNPRVINIHHPIGQESLATSTDYPAVLYDDGAAFCSPILVFDQNGSAIHCHDDPIGARALGDYGFRYLDEHFLPELQRRVMNGRVSSVMGGTNVDTSEEGQRMDVENSIDWAIRGVKTRLASVYPDIDFYPLISKQYDNQHETHSIIPPKTTMRGFIFIPKYLAKDKKNHVLAISNENNANAMRNAFYWTRLSRR